MYGRFELIYMLYVMYFMREQFLEVFQTKFGGLFNASRAAHTHTRVAVNLKRCLHEPNTPAFARQARARGKGGEEECVRCDLTSKSK